MEKTLEEQAEEFENLVIDLEAEPEKDDEPEDQQASQEEEEEQPKPRAKRKNDVQKRIDQLTWQAREAERREDEVLRRNQILEERLSQLEDRMVDEESRNLESQERTLRSARAKAREDGDYDKLDEIDDELMEVRLKRRVPQEPQQQRPQATQPQMTRDKILTATWLEDNMDWWENDPGKQQHALNVDRQLKSEGYDPNGMAYWRELDDRIAQYDDGRQEDTNTRIQGQQVVDSPRNETQKRKRAALTISREEQLYARELGIQQGTPAWDRYVNEIKQRRQ